MHKKKRVRLIYSDVSVLSFVAITPEILLWSGVLGGLKGPKPGGVCGTQHPDFLRVTTEKQQQVYGGAPAGDGRERVTESQLPRDKSWCV